MIGSGTMRGKLLPLHRLFPRAAPGPAVLAPRRLRRCRLRERAGRLERRPAKWSPVRRTNARKNEDHARRSRGKTSPASHARGRRGSWRPAARGRARCRRGRRGASMADPRESVSPESAAPVERAGKRHRVAAQPGGHRAQVMRGDHEGKRLRQVMLGGDADLGAPQREVAGGR
jgi:hypothetical protein